MQNMIRTTFQFLIQRAIDRQRPPHPWLRKAIDRSEPLTRYTQQAEKLDDLLRTSATARRESLECESPAASVAPIVRQPMPREKKSAPIFRRPVAARWGWLAGGVTALLFVGLFIQQSTERQTRAAHAEFLSQQLAAAPDEVLHMLHRATLASQDELARYAPATRWSLPEFSPWEQVATQVQTPIERSATLLVNEWTGLTEVLGRWSIEEPTAEIDGGGI